MQTATKVGDMSINPTKITTESQAKALFKDYTSYEDFIEGALYLEEKGIEILSTLRYIVYLYSEDSILNVRPPMPLDERQARALELSGIVKRGKEPTEHHKKYLVNLGDRRIFEFIFEFLTKQKKFTWQEIITLETQILENQMLRLRPVDEESGKDELMAFERKGKMTTMYKEWYSILREFYDEFYGDNENVRAIHKINRGNMASLENIAF